MSKMSTGKLVFFLVLAIVALILAIVYLPYNKHESGSGQNSDQDSQTQTETTESDVVNPTTRVEEYIRANISDLSPEPAVLGGAFFVTRVSFDEASPSGHVEYEDGHVMYRATFAYGFDENGNVVIPYFVIEPDLS